MSRERDPECRGFLVQETDNAICVCKNNAPAGGEVFWVPKSQIGYRRTTKNADPAKWAEVVFTIPEWLIEKKQCWGLVP